MTHEEKLSYFVPGMIGYYRRGASKVLVRVISDEGDLLYGKDQSGNVVSLPTYPMVNVKVLNTGKEKLVITWLLEPLDPLSTLGAAGE